MKRYAVTAVILLLCLTGCSVYQVTDAPQPLVEVPAGYSIDSRGETALERWWEGFGDSRLNQVVTTVLTENLDLQMAWSRLDQAAALAGQAAAGQVPVVSLELQNARSRTNVPRTYPLSGTNAQHANQHSLSLGAAYELDLWGKLAAQKRAAKLDFSASRMDLETMQMTMAAQAVEVCFSLIEQREQLALLKHQLDINATYLELVEMRFALGLAGSVDVYRQRQQVAALRAQIPMMESGLEVISHQLNVLMGRPPAVELQELPEKFPEVWSRPAAGLPSDLLLRRPDLQASRMRVAAADNRVGAAVADRYPSFSIAASTPKACRLSAKARSMSRVSLYR